MDLKVFISHQDSTCDECGEKLGHHACQKYSGRVGRSAQAKALDEKSILLAVIAHIRHAETNYDELLVRGLDRSMARNEIQSEIDRLIVQWKAG